MGAVWIVHPSAWVKDLRSGAARRKRCRLRRDMIPAFLLFFRRDDRGRFGDRVFFLCYG